MSQFSVFMSGCVSDGRDHCVAAAEAAVPQAAKSIASAVLSLFDANLVPLGGWHALSNVWGPNPLISNF